MMTQRAVARALGISRTYEQILERRALAKVAVALGEVPPDLPHWIPTHGRHIRCHACGGSGHNRRGCTEWTRQDRDPKATQQHRGLR